MKLVYRVNPDQRLIIVEHAVQQMVAYKQQHWWSREAGGILMGRHLLDSRDVVVDEVSTPQKSDRRSRFSFFRSSRHERIAYQRWEELERTSAYLGLWHTHPEPDPNPSSVDRRDWQQAVSGDTFEGDCLFFPIIGTERIRVWCLSRCGLIWELTQEVRNG